MTSSFAGFSLGRGEPSVFVEPIVSGGAQSSHAGTDSAMMHDDCSVQGKRLSSQRGEGRSSDLQAGRIVEVRQQGSLRVHMTGSYVQPGSSRLS